MHLSVNRVLCYWRYLLNIGCFHTLFNLHFNINILTKYNIILKLSLFWKAIYCNKSYNKCAIHLKWQHWPCRQDWSRLIAIGTLHEASSAERVLAGARQISCCRYTWEIWRALVSSRSTEHAPWMFIIHIYGTFVDIDVD